MLGLNKDNKPLSQQTPQQISESFHEIAIKLQNPEVMKNIKDAIHGFDPVIQELMVPMIDVLEEAGKTLYKDMYAIFCELPPFSFLCGDIKLLENGANFGSEFFINSSKIMDILGQKSAIIGDSWTKLKNAFDILVSSSQKVQSQIMNQIESTNKPLQQQANNAIQQQANLVTNLKGGAKTLKKYRKEKKQILHRINHSIRSFINIKSKQKTRSINRLSKTKSKSKSKM
jgi:hypothetical protein